LFAREEAKQNFDIQKIHDVLGHTNATHFSHMDIPQKYIVYFDYQICYPTSLVCEHNKGSKKHEDGHMQDHNH